MDIDRIIQSRKNRKTREGRPLEVFLESFKELRAATDYLLTETEVPFHRLMERAVVVGAVTAVETYYKDILEMIFKTCSPEFIKPVLRDIHRTKYDIDDLVLMHENSVHPLELIVTNQSFQNADTIEAVFTKYIRKSLWGTVIGMKVRIKDEPETEEEFDHSSLDALKKLFEIRHEIVHNPAYQRLIINDDFHTTLLGAMFIVFGSNLVLTNLIVENCDPELQTTKKLA